MKLEILPDVDAVARRAAQFIAVCIGESVASRGRALLALSGGSTPRRMLRLLAKEEIPWEHVHLFQVDERVAPAGHADRNLVHIRENLLVRVPLPARQFHAMPVEDADLPGAAAEYALELRKVAGVPAVFDLVHLGLGADGHTASLVPGDPALTVEDADVALSGPYGGHRRMTLTFPAISRARRILWVITGADKAAMLTRLRRGDAAIPAGRIERSRALILADADAGARNAP